MAKKLQEGNKSIFLENLKHAVETGDRVKGAESINKINEIHKLASSMDSDVAEATFSKRVDDAGLKDVIEPKERKIMSVESERERLRIEKEENKLRFMAEIQNSEYELKAVNIELEDVIKQYKNIIEMQEEELNILKIKFEAKYGE